MPHRSPFLIWLSAWLSRHAEQITISLIILTAETGRVFYRGGTFRRIVGETIFCLLVAHCLYHHIPDIPPILGVKITSTDVAVTIGLLGMHGIKRLFAFAIKRQTGENVRVD
ncbi:phage holin family protein [Enterobacter sp. RHB15-C17]|nr:phage holin family protein [Enterobacter sp. RHB15-C17]